MSKFRNSGFGWGLSITEAAQRGLREATLQQSSGTHYTGRSKGYGAFRDNTELNSQLADASAAFRYAGAAGPDEDGVLKLAVVKSGAIGTTTLAAGTVPMATFELGGKMFKAGVDGVARIIDGEACAVQIEAYNQMTEYELKIMKICQISDEMAKKLLTKPIFDKLEATGAPAGITDAEIIAVNATPASIQFLSPESKSYGLALTKLRAAVREAGVILNEEMGNAGPVKPLGGEMRQKTVLA